MKAVKWVVYLVASFAALWIAEAVVLVGVVSLGIQELFTEGIVKFFPETLFAGFVVGFVVFFLSGWLTDKLAPSPKAIVVLALLYTTYQALTVTAMLEDGQGIMVAVSVGSALGLIVQATLRYKTDRDIRQAQPKPFPNLGYPEPSTRPPNPTRKDQAVLRDPKHFTVIVRRDDAAIGRFIKKIKIAGARSVSANVEDDVVFLRFTHQDSGFESTIPDLLRRSALAKLEVG